VIAASVFNRSRVDRASRSSRVKSAYAKRLFWLLPESMWPGNLTRHFSLYLPSNVAY
jgi:hypothetical protein